MTRIGVRDIVKALLGAAADVVFPGRRERTEDYDAVRKAWATPRDYARDGWGDGVHDDTAAVQRHLDRGGWGGKPPHA